LHHSFSSDYILDASEPFTPCGGHCFSWQQMMDVDSSGNVFPVDAQKCTACD